jgi:hypothetical protein
VVPKARYFRHKTKSAPAARASALIQVPAYNGLMLDVEFFDIIWKKGHGTKTIRNVVEVGFIELVYCSDGETPVQHR